MTLRVWCFAPMLVASASLAPAQTPPSNPSQATASATPPDAPPTPPPSYTYSVDGRRDPFVSLLNRGTADPGKTRSGAKRPDGVQGLLVNEVVVRGIVQSRGTSVAMVGAPNGKTYTVRPGDTLMDGIVRGITPQVVILMQEVNDPLSREGQREVRKYLRGGEQVQ
jgi:Tfp pilus assembly protein PilP